MRKIYFIIIIIVSLTFSCKNLKEKYIDISATNADQEYYNLTERLIEDDNGTKLSIGIPEDEISMSKTSPA